METLQQKPPDHTASRMVRVYGKDRAIEFANQYAADAQRTDNPNRWAYWNLVTSLIERARLFDPTTQRQD